VGSAVDRARYDVHYSQHNAGYFAWLSYFREVCGLTAETEAMTGLRLIAENCGWVLPCEHICWASERHNRVCQDEQQRLHAADGPAVAYPDGWELYYWHGVQVSKQVIMHPEALSAGVVTAERNAEVRRVMIERMGTARYLREAGARKVHTDDWGTLWQLDQRDDEPIVMVELLNATPEPDGSYARYWLRVPPAMQTAHDAVSWTFAENPASYAPLIQT